MKTFSEYLQEMRFKSPDEHKVRTLVSKIRTDYYKNSKYPPPQGKDKLARYGDCNPVSDKVVSELKKTWPKIRAVGSDYDSRWGYIKHTSVEIPELNLAIDPTHDQMHKYPKKKNRNPRNTIRTVRGLFPDNAVKIQPMDSPNYRNKYKDPKPYSP